MTEIKEVVSKRFVIVDEYGKFLSEPEWGTPYWYMTSNPDRAAGFGGPDSPDTLRALKAHPGTKVKVLAVKSTFSFEE